MSLVGCTNLLIHFHFISLTSSAPEYGTLAFLYANWDYSVQSRLPEGGGWNVSADVSCLTLTGVCCINTGISAAALLWPGHDDDDDDDDADDIGGGAVAVAAAGTCTGLDWLSHADDDVSVGCDSCRITWWGCDTDIVCAPTHTNSQTNIFFSCFCCKILTNIFKL